MVYEKKFPECPYRGVGNHHCSHKGAPKRCPCVYMPETCDMYNEWEKHIKDDSDSVETPKETI